MNVSAVSGNSYLQQLHQAQSTSHAKTATHNDGDGDTDPMGQVDDNDGNKQNNPLQSGLGRHLNLLG